MRFIQTEVPGVVIIEPDVHRDGRGFFLETYHQDRYNEAGIRGPFVQDNHSHSLQGTLRGLHAQVRRPQGKLVRAVQGEMFDVAVDIRLGSPSFGRWFGARLSGENFRQLYIPPGCAHGFYVVSPAAQVQYKCTELYDPADEIGIAWNDAEAAIPWPLQGEPLLSARDQANRPLREVLKTVEERRAGLIRT